MAGSEVRPGSREPAPPGRPFTILVVDDNPDTLASLHSLLVSQPEPPLVLVASSGPEGLDLLEGHPVDLVVADYRMKPMNGLEFLARTRERVPTVPRIMITSYPDLDVAIEAVNRGHVARFLLKPLNPKAFLEEIGRLQAEREAAQRPAQRFAADFEELRRHRHLKGR